MRAAILVPCVVAIGVAASGPVQDPVLSRVPVKTPAGAHVVLAVSVTERLEAEQAPAATALVVRVDGVENQHVILTPGVGRASYNALLGPLAEGSHEVTLERSRYWKWTDGITLTDIAARIVPASDPTASLLANAPAFGVRADTVGTASDLPLLLYAEDDRLRGTGWLRYSVIFSNEDGGTPAPALMARWGRTTDIELAIESEWRSGKMVQERFQGPDHRMVPFAGPRDGQHPLLLVATMNNMFLDRGASVATVRPVPMPVNIANATRESIMDAHPWMYRVMARELAAEGRIGPDLEDPREFLYVEARLDLEDAAVTALAATGDSWSESSRGQGDLTVARNAWARIAIPGSAGARALRWRCLPPPNRGTLGSCRIRTTRAFRLGPDYTPGPNLLLAQAASRAITLKGGTSDPLPLRQQ